MSATGVLRRVDMPLRGDRLRELRLRRNYTQQTIADRLGVKQPQYADWERGRYDPRADVVARMSLLLECTADYLLGLVDEPSQYVNEQTLPPDERHLLKLYRERRIPRVIRELLGDPQLFEDYPQPPMIEKGGQGDVSR